VGRRGKGIPTSPSARKKVPTAFQRNLTSLLWATDVLGEEPSVCGSEESPMIIGDLVRTNSRGLICVFLVSTDGTAEQMARKCSELTLISCKGNLC